MIEIRPSQKPVNAVVTVPGSKSYTNRALLVAALAEGRSRLTGALFSDDTHYMCEALRKLGVEIEADAEGCTFDVVGNGGKIPVDHAELYIGNAGTAARPLVSYVALGNGEFIIDGDAPMRQSRPISDLLDALKQLDVDVRSKFNNNFLRNCSGKRAQGWENLSRFQQKQSVFDFADARCPLCRKRDSD